MRVSRFEFRCPSAITMVVLAIVLMSARADAVGWVQKQVAGPSARSGHAMAYAANSEKIVLFSGCLSRIASQRVYGNDTWEWDGVSWTRKATTGPAGRYLHAMAYDEAKKRVVMFGGDTGERVFSSETWEWNGSVWTRVATIGPSPREGMAMAYDSSHNRTVLFGGATGGAQYSGETWEWNGASWSLKSTTGPGAREGASMVYDKARGKVVMFGGYTIAHGHFDDTWEWDGQKWTEVYPNPKPQARVFEPLAYDSGRNRTVMFGGYLYNGGYFGDTWEYDGTSWTQTYSTGPSSRGLSALAYDAARGQTVLFGGWHAAPLGETWVYEGGSTTVLPLKVTLTAPPRIMPGKPLPLDIQIRNNGPVPVTLIEVSNTLPPLEEFGSNSTLWTYNASSRTTTYRIAAMGANSGLAEPIRLNLVASQSAVAGNVIDNVIAVKGRVNGVLGTVYSNTTTTSVISGGLPPVSTLPGIAIKAQQETAPEAETTIRIQCSKTAGPATSNASVKFTYPANLLEYIKPCPGSSEPSSVMPGIITWNGLNFDAGLYELPQLSAFFRCKSSVAVGTAIQLNAELTAPSVAGKRGTSWRMTAVGPDPYLNSGEYVPILMNGMNLIGWDTQYSTDGNELYAWLVAKTDCIVGRDYSLHNSRCYRGPAIQIFPDTALLDQLSGQGFIPETGRYQLLVNATLTDSNNTPIDTRTISTDANYDLIYGDPSDETQEKPSVTFDLEEAGVYYVTMRYILYQQTNIGGPGNSLTGSIRHRVIVRSNRVEAPDWGVLHVDVVDANGAHTQFSYSLWRLNGLLDTSQATQLIDHKVATSYWEQSDLIPDWYRYTIWSLADGMSVSGMVNVSSGSRTEALAVLSPESNPSRVDFNGTTLPGKEINSNGRLLINVLDGNEERNVIAVIQGPSGFILSPFGGARARRINGDPVITYVHKGSPNALVAKVIEDVVVTGAFTVASEALAGAVVGGTVGTATLPVIGTVSVATAGAITGAISGFLDATTSAITKGVDDYTQAMLLIPAARAQSYLFEVAIDLGRKYTVTICSTNQIDCITALEKATSADFVFCGGIQTYQMKVSSANGPWREMAVAYAGKPGEPLYVHVTGPNGYSCNPQYPLSQIDYKSNFSWEVIAGDFIKAALINVGKGVLGKAMKGIGSEVLKRIAPTLISDISNQLGPTISNWISGGMVDMTVKMTCADTISQILAGLPDNFYEALPEDARNLVQQRGNHAKINYKALAGLIADGLVMSIKDTMKGNSSNCDQRLLMVPNAQPGERYSFKIQNPGNIGEREYTVMISDWHVSTTTTPTSGKTPVKPTGDFDARQQ